MSKDSPLFLLENNQALTRPHQVNFVSHLLRLIGVDPTAYSGHSFRIGGATSASLADVADQEIQMLGRWKSDCYKTYVRFVSYVSFPLNVLLQFPQRMVRTASITYQYANPYHQNAQDSQWTASFALFFQFFLPLTLPFGHLFGQLYLSQMENICSCPSTAMHIPKIFVFTA